jgi:hypothetical protein
VDKLLRTLLRRLECNPPRVSRVDLGGGASRLEQLGLIVPAEPARGVACQHCDGPYCLPVEFVRHVPSGTLHGYISCSQCGLSQVDPRQLDRWRVSAQGLLASVVSSLAGAARSPAVVIEEKLWSAGKLHLTVKTALQLINRFLAEDDFDADTQFCLHWFEQYGWESGKFGEADTLARAKGTSVEGVKQAGVLHAAGGNVRLLKWREYPSDWDPRTDPRLFQAIDAVDSFADRHTITLSTLHKAKGREWDNVELLDDFNTPDGSSVLQAPEKAAEEMRINYVALTRARHAVKFPDQPGMWLYHQRLG